MTSLDVSASRRPHLGNLGVSPPVGDEHPVEQNRSGRSQRPRVTFITNLASHYRVRTFELLAERYDTRFVFYSNGGEANWLPEHGVSSGQFAHQYLAGFSVAGVRISPRLIPIAWMDRADVVIKCLNGKFAMPV